MNAFHEQALKILTPDSNLTEMLRTMYRTGVDHCVMLPSWDFRDYVVFTKDQLVLLIERDSPDVRISDIPRLAAEGAFKPLLFSDRPTLPDDADVDPDELPVLVVEDDQVGLSSLREAIASQAPDLPAWWEAPVPLVMHRRRRIYPNPTAERMFGEELRELPRDLPEKDEFLVSLRSGDSPRSLMFRRLEDDIFTLEDCTGDVLAAADIAWWAALGKAWMTILDKGKRVYRRYEKAEIEEMGEEERAALSAENTLISCEWEDGIVGYLCVRKKLLKKSPVKTKTEKAEKTGTAARKSLRTGKQTKTKDLPAEEEAREGVPEEASVEVPKEEHEILKALGPQAMGLLAPGAGFSAAGELSSAEGRAPWDGQVQASPPAYSQASPQASSRGQKARKAPRSGARGEKNTGEENA
ncbi:MAG: hypothetical protein LBO82_01510 [Synergistaceae bacterium]|nr:hypothetical protein [Synergistaceae bacterium]